MRIFHPRRWRKHVVSSACATVLGFLGTAGPAQADIIYFYNNPGGYQATLNGLGIVDANVLYNDPSLTLVGNPVQGTTQGGFVLNYSTVGDVLVANGGQARIEAQDGSYDDLLIDPLDPSVFFRSLSFNLNPLTVGDVSFTVVDQFGANPTQVQSVGVAGLFFFGAISINGQLIDNVSFASTGQVTDIRQVRVGGVVAAPEPASLVLLGIGVVGAGFARRRRHAKG